MICTKKIFNTNFTINDEFEIEKTKILNMCIADVSVISALLVSLRVSFF